MPGRPPPDPAIAAFCCCCGKPRRKRTGQGGYVGAHGRCGPCDDRWRRHGRPVDGPPPPMGHTDRTARSSRTLRQAKAQRMTEYTQARDAGLTPAQAAAEAGVSTHTARVRYEPAYWRGLTEDEAPGRVA